MACRSVLKGVVASCVSFPPFPSHLFLFRPLCSFFLLSPPCSGQVVRGGPPPTATSIFASAERHGASRVSDESGGISGGSSGAFRGQGRTLAGEVVEGGPPAPRRISIEFFSDGTFSIEGAAPRDLRAPEERAFLECLHSGRVPEELQPEDPRQQVEVEFLPRPGSYEDHHGASGSGARAAAFKGRGQKLGGDAGSSQAAAQEGGAAQERGAAQEGGAPTAAGPAGPSSPSSTLAPWIAPDASLPTTSVSVRLPDGARLRGLFNLTSTVRDLRRFVATARPDLDAHATMMSSFPPKALTNDDATIQDEGLQNAMVSLK